MIHVRGLDTFPLFDGLRETEYDAILRAEITDGFAESFADEIAGQEDLPETRRQAIIEQ